LGHSAINMTADVYTHTSAEAEREAALAVERAIYGDLFPKWGTGTTAWPSTREENDAALPVTKSEKGASGICPKAPMVAGGQT